MRIPSGKFDRIRMPWTGEQFVLGGGDFLSWCLLKLKWVLGENEVGCGWNKGRK